MDESQQRGAQAVVETSYDEKVSSTCKSSSWKKFGGRGRKKWSLAVQLALHCPCCLTNAQINAHTCFCYYTWDDIFQSSQSHF